MNAQAREVLAPLYPAPLDYQASVVLQQRLADIEASFTRRRAELLSEHVEQAEVVRADHAAMTPADFIGKYA